MKKDSKAEIKAWAEAWKRVNDLDDQERAALTVEERMRQFSKLFTECKRLGWDKNVDEEGIQLVRDRWNELRRAYAAQAGGI